MTPFVCLVLRADTCGQKRGSQTPRKKRQKQTRQRVNQGQTRQEAERVSRQRQREKRVDRREIRMSEEESTRDIKSLCHVQQEWNTYFIFPKAGH